MTVEILQEVKLIAAQEVTAFGRLEFFGLVKIGGFHMKMKKTVNDYKALVPNLVNSSDSLSMAQLCHRTGKDKEIFNDDSKIHKNDSSFERHVQWKDEVATQVGLNLFHNHDEKFPEKLDAVIDNKSATAYIKEMWEDHGVIEQLFYDPAVHDPTQMRSGPVRQGEDDMWIYSLAAFDR